MFTLKLQKKKKSVFRNRETLKKTHSVFNAIPFKILCPIDGDGVARSREKLVGCALSPEW